MSSTTKEPPPPKRRRVIRFGLASLFVVIALAAFLSRQYLLPFDSQRLNAMVAWLQENDGYRWYANYRAEQPSTKIYEDFFYPWYGRRDYDRRGYEFQHIGEDGAGNQYAVWHRPGSRKEPLVYFDHEGGSCVLTDSVWNWPLILAHGVSTDQYDYPYFDNAWTQAAPVDPTQNEYLHVTKIRGAKPSPESIKRHAEYKQAVIDEYGPLPDLEKLLGDRDKLSRELHEWVNECHGP